MSANWPELLAAFRARMPEMLSKLSEPFSDECVERTKGSQTGKGYDTTAWKYIYITQRLNEVVGIGNWRVVAETKVLCTKTKAGRDKYEAITEGVLELGIWVYDTHSAFATMASASAYGGHASFVECDAKKGSLTNFIKKAAALFGCGWQAYAGIIDDDAGPLPEAQEQRRAPRADRTAPERPGVGASRPVTIRDKISDVVEAIKRHVDGPDTYLALSKDPAVIPSRELGVARAGEQILAEFNVLLTLVTVFWQKNQRPVTQADIGDMLSRGL